MDYAKLQDRLKAVEEDLATLELGAKDAVRQVIDAIRDAEVEDIRQKIAAL